MRALLLVSLMLAASPAVAQQGIRSFMSGNRLHAECADESALYEIGVCSGYAMAWAEASAASGKACLTEGVDLTQLVDVIRAYLTEHPNRRHWAAQEIATSAIEEAFPCR